MKKIVKLAALAALAFSFASCESFLDTTNYWSKDSSNFPVNATDAEQMLAGIYNNLNAAIGGDVHLNHFLWSIASSDDALGGGGQNDPVFQAEDLLMNVGADMYNDFYVTRYKGIARANAAINALPNCGVADKLNQYMGEAFFLRAWYYYELASMFGNIPCPVTTAADPTQPQISGEALWGQIVEDCKIAADIMPAKQSVGDGHVDKYAAEALLGRAWLFATGFLGISDVTLPAYENDAIGVNIAEGTKLTIGLKAHKGVPRLIGQGEDVGDHHLALSSDQSELVPITIPESFIQTYEGIPDKVIKAEVADDSAGTIGSNDAILSIFLGSHVAQSKRKVVAHEVEEIIGCRDKNLTYWVLDSSQPCSRIDELVVGPIVSIKKVIQLTHDFITVIVRQLFVGQFLTQQVELVQ